MPCALPDMAHLVIIRLGITIAHDDKMLASEFSMTASDPACRDSPKFIDTVDLWIKGVHHMHPVDGLPLVDCGAA